MRHIAGADCKVELRSQAGGAREPRPPRASSRTCSVSKEQSVGAATSSGNSWATLAAVKGVSWT